MKLALLAFTLALPATQVQAQSVGGQVVIHSGPVSAAVVFGPRPAYRPRPYYAPRVAVVSAPYRGDGYWSHYGYQRATLWYDADRDCYFDRGDPRYGYRPVVVYQRGGRFFREAGFQRGHPDGWDHERGHGRGHGHDNHDRGGWHDR